MHLDAEIKAALHQEAEIQSVPPLNVVGLIRGGRVRRRRRALAQMGVAAAAAVIIGAGSYGVTQVSAGSNPSNEAGPAAVGPSTPAAVPPALVGDDGSPIEPGTYRMSVTANSGRNKIYADLAVTGPDWKFSGQPIVSAGDTWAGVGIYQPDQLAGSTACYGNWQGRDAAPTPQALARQLVALPRSTVIQPPTPTVAFGHDAVHLRLLIDDQCPDLYQIAKDDRKQAVGRGISYSMGNARKKVLIDFWVVDLDGTPVVVDMWHQGDASTELVSRAAQVRDTITFVTDK